MEEMDLLELWHIVAKRKLLIAVLFVGAIIAAFTISMLTEPVYEATTTIMVQEQSTAQNMLFGSMGGTGASSVQNYVEIMRSRRVLEPVQQEVGLEEESLTSIRNRLTIQPVQGTDIVRVSMQSTDPEEAQLFVNTLADSFIEWNRYTRQEDQRNARIFIEEQLANIETQLVEAEERLRAYQEEERAMSPSAETVAKLEQIAVLEGRLSDVRVSRAEITERIERMRQQLENEDETFLSSTTIAQNPFVTQYQNRLADLEISLSGARERYTSNHPSILSLEAEIEDVKSKLADQVERVVSTETRSVNPIHRELYGSLVTLEVELIALDSRESAIAAILEQEDQELSLLPGKELTLARLMRDTKVLEEIYLTLMTRNEETRITEAMQTADVQVIDSALVPQSPIKPRVMLNIAIAAVLGIFLGIGLAFLLEFIDTSIKTKEEAESILELPVLGQIPDFSLKTQDRKKRFFGR